MTSTLVRYHVCPVARLKITKLYPCLTYFPGFLAILKVWPFFENGGTNLAPKQSSKDVLVNFSKVQQQSSNNFPSAASLTKVRKNLTTDTYRKLFQQKTVFLPKVGFLNCFQGTKVTTLMLWMIKVTINKSNLI